MSLIKGSLNLTRFEMQDCQLVFDIDLDNAIKRKAFIEIDDLPLQSEASGLVNVSDYLDTSFALESYNLNPYLLLGVRQDKRTLSPVLLTKYYRREVANFLQVIEDKRLTKPDRILLKEKARIKLAEKTAPVPSVWECFVNSSAKTIYIISGNANQAQLTMDLLKEIFTFAPIWPKALQALAQLGEEKYGEPGRIYQEFLTWLWWQTVIEADYYWLKQRLLLKLGCKLSLAPAPGVEGSRIDVTGQDDRLTEAREALKENKLVNSIQLALCLESDIYNFTLDSKNMAPKGVKLPSTEMEGESDRDGLMLERIALIENLSGAYDFLLNSFVAMHQEQQPMLHEFNEWLKAD